MSTHPWLVIQRVKTATVPETVALDLIHDIDDAVRRRDAASLRNFAAEARASGMDQEAARAFELADVIEGKAATSARDELLKIKARSSHRRPRKPTSSGGTTRSSWWRR